MAFAWAPLQEFSFSLKIQRWIDNMEILVDL